MYLYSPKRSQAEVLRNLVADFVREALGGSVSPFVAYLAEEADLNHEEVRELVRLVADLEAQRAGGDDGTDDRDGSMISRRAGRVPARGRPGRAAWRSRRPGCWSGAIPGLTPRVACWAWRLADLKLVVALLWATPLLLPLLPPSPLRPGRRRDVRPGPELPPIPAGGSEPITEPAVGPAEPPRLHRLGPASVVAAVAGSPGSSARRSWRGRDGSMRAVCGGLADRSNVRDLQGAAVELAGVLGLRGVPELRAGPAVAGRCSSARSGRRSCCPSRCSTTRDRSLAIRPVLAP